MDLSSFFNQFLSSVAEYKVCQNLLLVCSAMACFVGHFIYCYMAMAMAMAAALSPSLSTIIQTKSKGRPERIHNGA